MADKKIEAAEAAEAAGAEPEVHKFAVAGSFESAPRKAQTSAVLTDVRLAGLRAAAEARFRELLDEEINKLRGQPASLDDTVGVKVAFEVREECRVLVEGAAAPAEGVKE